ncbi:MAG: PEPxxWA-CTERM sorting domain-containing protein, partial [Caulobacteraceae bacterium]
GQEYAGTATFGPDANMGGANTELETISFEAVPEPAAWALLIAGAGLAGAGLRRRRAQLAAA